MPESLALVDALRAHGVPAVVSGAGPTVLVFGRTAAGDERPVDHRVTDADRALDEVFGGAMGGWRILRLGLSDDGALWRRLP